MTKQGWVYYGEHYGGVESVRGSDGTERTAWGRGLCQCGWRGKWRQGKLAGFAGSADHDAHRLDVEAS